MRLLVLGGTRFLGRHIVEAALECGHDVTIFHRGETNRGLFGDRVEEVLGDRDGGLGALSSGRWNAVVDTSGYFPRVVGASAKLLAERADHYTFVSSISIEMVCQSIPLLSCALSMTKVANPVTVVVKLLPLHFTIGIRYWRWPLLNMQTIS